MLITDSFIQFSNSYESNIPLPLPQSQSAHIKVSFSTRIQNAIMFTPRVLVKLTRRHSDPNQEKYREKKKRSRTMSQCIPNQNFPYHSRSKSSAVINYSKQKVNKAENLCRICGHQTFDTEFENCGHGELCFKCADIFVQSKKKCYVCKEEIKGIRKIIPIVSDSSNDFD